MKNRAIIDKDLLRGGGRVLVALSGGADSVCLLHALALMRDELGIEVCSAHFIHGIRPEAAEGELELVRRLCLKCETELFVGRGDTPAYAEEHGMGLEEAARTLRYAFLYRTMEEQGCRVIATAHNLSDNSETVLFDLVRGSGLAGISGIPRINGCIIRPLLGASRGEIEEYDRINGLEYAVDATNFDENYSRNRIRLSVMPQLRMINGRADENILALSRVIDETRDFMWSQAEGLLPPGRRGGELPLEIMTSCHPALRYYLICLLLEEAGGSRRDIKRIHSDAVSALAENGRVSSYADLPGGFRAGISYGLLRISRREEETLDGEIKLYPGRTVTWNGWRISAGTEAGTAFCSDAVSFPLTVRSRQPGDVIQLGFGRKNIKKYMIDKKIPAKTRDSIPIICDNKGVLLLGDLEKDRDRRYKGQGVPLNIECRRITSDGNDE